jgi:hypothetical protein
VPEDTQARPEPEPEALNPPPVLESPAPKLAANKLHEWGAALLIMIVLTAFLVFITRYLRGTTL